MSSSTPGPQLSYFLGKLLASLVEGVIQATLLITCAGLGVLLGGWVKDGRTASAVTLPPFLVLPDQALVAEPSHSWQLPQAALILAVWLVGGPLLALRTFRWKEKYER